jgi:Cdc6-like AAA superfamily ATPase
VTDVSGEPSASPFTAIPVASIIEATSFAVTVPTDSIRAAGDRLDVYLRSTGQGAVIAVTGDYGSGKTHLAGWLSEQARQTVPADRVITLAAREAGFLSLYRRLVQWLGSAGISALVNGYYADVVADALRSRQFDDDTVQWVRTRPEPPHDIVDKLGLMESALTREAGERLTAVTADPDAGTALTLLLREGFAPAVQNWLTGEPPSGVLRERGITRAIDTAGAAMDAIGMLALLLGGRQEKFVVVIDEFDKVLAGQDLAESDVALAALFEVFARSGGVVVLCGLSDLLDAIGMNTWQRMSAHIRMSALSSDDVCSLITMRQQAVTGYAELRPFTRSAVQYLTELAGGNARKVIRLCYHAFEAAGRASLVTNEIVAEAARNVLGLLSADGVARAAQRVLERDGWVYSPDHLLGDDREATADFWVTFPDRSDGCAVIITGSIVTGEDANTVTRRAFALRQAVAGSQVVVVVGGALNSLYAAQLAEALGTEPLVHVGHSFADDFSALIRAAGNRLTPAGEDDPLLAMGRRLDEMSRQQATIVGFFEHLAGVVDDGRQSADAGIAEIRGQLETLAESVAGIPRTGAAALPAPGGVPSEVDRMFQDALALLDELSHLDRMVSAAFAGTTDIARGQLGSAELITALGTTSVLLQAVVQFRAEIGRWYESQVEGQPAEQTAAALDQLDELCRAYEKIAELQPVIRLEPLFQLLKWNPGAVHRKIDWRRRAHRVLDTLGADIHRSVLKSRDIRAG